jgi:hypothetical protein
MKTILLSAKEILQPTIHAHANLLIDRPAPAIFHYIAAEFFENYPKWSPEVLELEPLTPGPVRLGTQARQVRVDKGRRSESTFQIAVYQPARQIDFVSTSSPHYRAHYRLEPIQEATRLHFAFELQLDFFLKPLKPIITPVLWAESARVVYNLKQLLEAQATRPGAAPEA